MSDLPEFEKRPKARVMPLVLSVFGNDLVQLDSHDDGHFRVIFRGGVFTIPEGQDQPSESQWSTLKKRMKRRDRRIFLYRKHGQTTCPGQESNGCYYLDFGYFLYD